MVGTCTTRPSGCGAVPRGCRGLLVVDKPCLASAVRLGAEGELEPGIAGDRCPL
eukprot:CAMPEP_0194483492 /NCGR_PEP_ID=MMETSP0253-20130528/5081_1 /TAXON_ID=2966 /ORGANISM="Noctiluca scintillans" /LENGTH=53 /DNA_ID=CAMNT_0039323159 /DNA_START=229 /DNA_END=387 /DNA_ORIENTATION=-